MSTSYYDGLFSKLLERGLVYRYTEPEWERLKPLGGKLYESPWRLDEVGKDLVVEELIQPTLNPVLLSADEWAYLEWLAECWPKFMAAQDQIFSQDRQVAKLVATQKEIEVREKGISSGYEVFSPFIRLDCVRDEEGKLRIVDINSTRPAGVGENLVLSEVMFPEYYSPIREVFTRTVKTCWEQWCQSHGSQGPARVAVVSDLLAGDWHNFRIIADLLAQESWVEKAEVTEDLDFSDSSPHCFLRSRIKEGHPQFPNLEQAYADGQCVISPLYRRWIGNKIWMYLIGQKKYAKILQKHLGDGYQDFIQAFVLTGLYTGDEVAFADGRKISINQLNRKEWVVKEPKGSSGKGMHFGRKSSGRRWDKEMAKLPDHSVFQRCYYRSAKENMTVLNEHGVPVEKEFYIKYGIFLFNGELAGVEVMARPSHLVHGARDTYLTLAVKEPA